MDIGKDGEAMVLEWLSTLKHKNKVHEIIDVRDFRIHQQLDADVIIEDINRKLTLAEIKTDKRMANTPNYLFEWCRINHFVSPDKVFYLGWAFRSPAKYLLYYSPQEKKCHKFLFSDIRSTIGRYVDKHQPPLKPIATDKQKTTYIGLIPKAEFNEKVRVYDLSHIQLKNKAA
jgi:hypothetical protein